MTAGSIREANAANIDAIVAAPGVQVLDFWADWCAPCHAMHPVLEEFAGANRPRVSVWSLDTVEHPELAERFGVRNLPTLLVFRDGEQVHRSSGVKRRSQLDRILAEASGAQAG